jgi:hypothetical protein
MRPPAVPDFNPLVAGFEGCPGVTLEGHKEGEEWELGQWLFIYGHQKSHTGLSPVPHWDDIQCLQHGLGFLPPMQLTLWPQAHLVSMHTPFWPKFDFKMLHCAGQFPTQLVNLWTSKLSFDGMSSSPPHCLCRVELWKGRQMNLQSGAQFWVCLSSAESLWASHFIPVTSV